MKISDIITEIPKNILIIDKKGNITSIVDYSNGRFSECFKKYYRNFFQLIKTNKNRYYFKKKIEYNSKCELYLIGIPLNVRNKFNGAIIFLFCINKNIVNSIPHEEMFFLSSIFYAVRTPNIQSMLRHSFLSIKSNLKMKKMFLLTDDCGYSISDNKGKILIRKIEPSHYIDLKPDKKLVERKKYKNNDYLIFNLPRIHNQKISYLIETEQNTSVSKLNSIHFFLFVNNLFVERLLQFEKLTNDYKVMKNINNVTDKFIRHFSHELRNSFSIIKGYMQFGINKQYSLKKIYNIVNDEIDSLLYFNDIIMNINEMKEGHLDIEFKNHSLLALIKFLLGELKPKLKEKRIKIVKEFIAKCELPCDLILLKKAFTNILNNLIDLADNNSIIYIMVKKSSIIFQNHGSGIDEKILKKLGKEMFVKNYKERAGIGVYFAKSILDLHNLNLMLSNTKDGVEYKITRK